MDLAVIIDPTDDHVSPGVAVVLGETESDVAEGLHLDLECNIPLAGRPQHQEIIVQDGAVLPLDGDDTADEEEMEEEERADRSLHLSTRYRSKHLKQERRIPEATVLFTDVIYAT